jgi:inhibitor of cysteine peptidase
MRAKSGVIMASALAAVALLVAACAVVPNPPGGPARIGESANGTKVELAVGQSLELSLPGNATTGYDWALDGALPSQLATVSDSYETTAPAGIVGAGGVHAFLFVARSPGTGTLKLRYARSWETGVAPLKTFAVTVTVR